MIGTVAIGLAFVCSVGALISLPGRASNAREVTSSLWNYAVSAGVDAKLQILVDPISVFMILVVTGVSTLIHLYSTAYMRSDKGYARYFSYLNYFVLSMLMLVLGGNFVILIIGWAFVGAASYLLISFWYRRTTATTAGIKAFVINVVGDVGLVLGTFFIFRHTHTVSFLGTFAAAPHVFHTDSTDLVAGCLLFLVGAFAKSAQIPLHTWLPDAMEGPTPVSSLIHAATMVTAGVYLIVRLHPLFGLAPTAADVGAIVGCLTLLIAGSIGLVMTDLKRVIAYSTMSQIGYMIMGASAGAYSAALFHLMTHAFFKALLFMAAGSIIGAMAGNQSLDRMYGFRKALPFTFACFIVGGLALSGIPPFSGWFSKDVILAYLNNRGGIFEILGILGYVGALLTGLIHVPDDLPRVLRRALPGGGRARARTPRSRRRAAQPADRRGGGHRRRLPWARARDRRARVGDEDRDERARDTGRDRRLRAGARRRPRDQQASWRRRSPARNWLPRRRSRAPPPRGSAWSIGAVIGLTGIGIAYGDLRRQAGYRGAAAGRLPRCTTSWLTSGTSTS